MPDIVTNVLYQEIDSLRLRVKELEAERDADRRREYGYSQQTIDALTAERDKLTARVKELEAEMREIGVAT
jgi:chromosome segregation ATPase